MRSAGGTRRLVSGLRQKISQSICDSTYPTSAACSCSAVREPHTWTMQISGGAGGSYMRQQLPVPLGQKPWTVLGARSFADQAEASQSGESKILEKLRSAAQEGTADALLGVLEQHGQEFGESEVETAFQELARVAKSWSDADKQRLHDAPAFQTLIDMVIMGRGRFQAGQLTNILQLAADLNLDDQTLLDRVSQTLMTRIGTMTAEELTQLATSLKRLDHSPSVVLFDAVQQRVVEVSDSVSPEEKSALEAAFRDLGYGHKDISEKV